MAEKKLVEKKVSEMKKKLLKQTHTHAGTTYVKGTPLENLKAGDLDIQYLDKLGII